MSLCNDDLLSDTGKLLFFRNSLIHWGKSNFRSFPWRLTEDPYSILMAEVMLHRTQVSQVLLVYNRFIAIFPCLEAFLQATREELFDCLYSLGLKWRVDLLYEMGLEIKGRFGSKMPQDKLELLSLPGVNEYIAGALRCFAWNMVEPLADTNTTRVVGRVFGLTIKPSSRRSPVFKMHLESLVDPENPRSYNYALLDLAALLCRKRCLPECTKCPVVTCCRYGSPAIKST